ncbi:thaumatin-like protein 1 [Syzygium oleosum]|uniref:thaumatin-like protein 1 n=1 Tax=Syzygium oleosum TaxID=219896 RepID=UPI0024BB4BF1|nr:thaumatin-like protein 1 [Syzygium oleosum]
MASLGVAVALFLHFLIFWVTGGNSATFTIVNKCGFTVWPGILSGAGTAPLSTTGFALDPGASASVAVPASWSGRLWGRTFCSQDPATGKFACLTGDCGSSALECSGSGAVPPATLAEFTLNGADGLDFYDVSLVDGYNLPMLVVPQRGAATAAGNCTATGCVADLNRACPQELKVTRTGSEGGVACKSACGAFGDPQYCCSGAHGSPDTCEPSQYSEFFKTACPKAYSYAYDDRTSTFTCASADYEITFCPTPSTSVKAAGGEYAVAAMASSGVASSWTPLSVVAVVVPATGWQLRRLFVV